MTSSSYCELRIRHDITAPLDARRYSLDEPWAEHEPVMVRAEEAFAVAVHRSDGATGKLRLRLGNEIIAEVPATRSQFETDMQPWLLNDLGESRLVVEQEVEGDTDGETGQFVKLVEVGLEIAARPEVERDFHLMLKDVLAVHEGLAQDVLGRAFLRMRVDGGAAKLQPELEAARLEELHARLELALERIACQPSVMLDRSARLARYRGGDRIDATAAAYAARDPETRIDPYGRVTALGKVRVRVPALSDDLPEHRHIAEGLRRLSRRAEKLAQHCERSAELVRREEIRWGGSRRGQPSVFALRYLPRVEALEMLAARYRRTATAFRQLPERHAFLHEVGLPRVPLGPTPTFLCRPAYREVYRILLEAQRPLGALIDSDGVRFAYRSLASLYEYWCFLQTVAYLRSRLGTSRSGRGPALIDDIYRPELAPGQAFEFPVPGTDLTLAATYEPDIRPWRTAQQRGDRYGASLTGDPLRPDILLELLDDRGVAAAMVLDAKCTDNFTPARFRDLTDYARQVFELKTWRQPIRHVFLLHRDRRSQPLSNLPRALLGRALNSDVMVLGAVPCVPDQAGRFPEALAQVIDGFLATFTPT